MARMRSPSYPSVSLKQAIELVSKIHRQNRTNVLPREVAADAMGYSGLTGRSLSVLSALLQFGLITKAGKGDVRVSQTAVDILHGIDQNERNAALLKAGFAPQLFRDIHERFPDGIPSENAIRSFLIKQEFHDVAIGPAINAFMETYHALADIRESESHSIHSITSEEPPEIASPTQMQEIQVTSDSLGPTPVSHAAVPVDAVLNKINMNIMGDRVHVEALLDRNGLLALEKKIVGLKALLDDSEDLIG